MGEPPGAVDERGRPASCYEARPVDRHGVMARAGRSDRTAHREIARRRLRSQLLATTALTRPADVVAWFGAVQAQDYYGALWAIGQRLVDARARDIERAIADRTIVRSWPMRGTLHFVAAADAAWMIRLLAPKSAAAAANRLRGMGIDDGVVARAREALTRQLEGGRRLTRPAAYRVLEAAGISTEGQRGLHVLWRLAHDGVVCLGPREGSQTTFVLFDEWLPRAARPPRDEALAELARRYFASHGPATTKDFAWWAGLTLADARRATAIAGASVVEEAIAGDRYWSVPSALWPPGTPRASARALPPYDEFFVGYADRDAAVDPAHATRLDAFDLLGPVIVFDGRLIATWRRRVAEKKVTFSVSPLAPLSKPRAAAVDGALARYARFFELEDSRRAP